MSMRSVEDELAVDGSYQHISEALDDADDAEVPGDDHDGEATAEGNPLDLSDRMPSECPGLVRRLLLDGLSASELADRFGGVSHSEVGRVARGQRAEYPECDVPPVEYDRDEQGYVPKDDHDADDVESAETVVEESASPTGDQDAETPIADDLELFAEEVRQVEEATSGEIDVIVDSRGAGASITVDYPQNNE